MTLKSHARNVAFIKDKDIQRNHTKNITYRTLEIQPYLQSEMIGQSEPKILTAVRYHYLRGIKKILKFLTDIEVPPKMPPTRIRRRLRIKY